MWHAIVTAYKAVRRRPGFAVTAILILGLAAAANATILAVVHGVLLEPLRYHDPDRLVAVWPAVSSRTPISNGSASMPCRSRRWEGSRLDGPWR